MDCPAQSQQQPKLATKAKAGFRRARAAVIPSCIDTIRIRFTRSIELAGDDPSSHD
jgi:hypothetical protein